MDLLPLRYLRAVVRAGGFNRAAEREHVAQPAISKQIRRLEREVGAPLFQRAGRQSVLTPAGQLLYAYAERVFEGQAAVKAEIEGLASLTRGRVELSAVETLLDYLLPPALAELHRRYPGLQVRIEMESTAVAIQRVLSYEDEFALVVLPLAHPDLTVTPLLREDVVLLVPPDDPWADRGRISLAEVARRNLLLSLPGYGLRAALEAAATQAGVALHPALELRSQQALIRLVELGVGLTFAPRLCLNGLRERLVALTVHSPALQREVGWICRRGWQLSPAARVLLELIDEQRPQDGSQA